MKIDVETTWNNNKKTQTIKQNSMKIIWKDSFRLCVFAHMQCCMRVCLKDKVNSSVSTDMGVLLQELGVISAKHRGVKLGEVNSHFKGRGRARNRDYV